MGIGNKKFSLITSFLFLANLIFAQDQDLLKNFLTVDDGLSHNEVTAIVQDHDGFIWIGTKSGGVSKYNPETGKFKNIHANYIQFNPVLNDNRILCFYEDKNGKIWMGTWNSGLIVYDENKESSKFYLENIRVNSVVESSNGKIWIGTNSGLFTGLQVDVDFFGNPVGTRPDLGAVEIQ